MSDSQNKQLEAEVANKEKLPDLPLQGQSIDPGTYKILQTKDDAISSQDAETHSHLWFKSPPLSLNLIQQLASIQLFADSHDQGGVDNLAEGLWTWFDLVLLADEHATSPIVKDGVELIWRSHRNSPSSRDWSWNSGKVFSTDSDILRFLEPGNCIGVQLAARFRGWELYARRAVLVFEVAKEHVERSKPPQYGLILHQARTIQEAFDEINHTNDTLFQPKVARQVFHRADGLKAEKSGQPQVPLRVLSLDGGGVRGYSSLLILDAILTEAKIEKPPYQIFDLIGGTSTGGLIAIMLGRLQMPIKNCIKKYENLVETVFAHKAKMGDPMSMIHSALTKVPIVGGLLHKADPQFLDQGFFYSPGPLEKAIKDAIKEVKIDENAPLNEGDTPGTKVFVLAVQKADTSAAPVLLRSYLNKEKATELPDVKIWEAARATSAAPGYFPSIPIKSKGGKTIELVDGGLAANNPLGWLWTEVATVFGPSRPTDVFLSIGTGVAPRAGLDDIVLKASDISGSIQKIMHFGNAVASAATNSEATNVLFKVLIKEFAPKAGAPKYYRFNYNEFTKDGNNAELAAMDDGSSINKMRESTQRWIDNNKPYIEAAAKALQSSLAVTSAQK